MKPSPFIGRSLARFMAVQGLYAMDVGQVSLRTVQEMMAMGQFGDGEEAHKLVAEDGEYFDRLIVGVTQEQASIDDALMGMLPKAWPINRIDATLRALLRSAAFELMRVSDVSAATVIDEYVEIARDFFEGDEPKFVNGVLDGFAKAKGLNRQD
ncbi:MAG TPA: transcription antitermination factor NusB [Alphaproteobacteria bacterium]|nr:MAG: transcription antitermination factor NusB [SAR116 cluster bacterium]HBQ22771.1 transcription antitermination factor NusB [Alphaproteobacteria bacterium]HCY47724.1 transcription antitermination factor NusB [Alphaproteobacteria bacterium]|tara:strand:- start:1700 stop:2161 length:462 start_codon:yes stop_codon:yes gene_type:complete